MALEFQRSTIAAVRAALPEHQVIEKPRTPAWLNRPGSTDCGDAWPLVRTIYRQLAAADLPEVMPPRERRSLDAVILGPDGHSRILEVDETQHFNEFRALTLQPYPASARTAFDRQDWIDRSRAKTRLEGGGFGARKPPLFPGQHGRHRQRAFRDALADLLPPLHGWEPTLRIHHGEAQSWIDDVDAPGRMRELLAEKLPREQNS
ncbi:MAG: hypothetical protein ACTIMA_10970 [Brachybacterium tyrofermentans]|uniref:Uncharacterized protein n=2 Tax=Brachybacterium tyrofermentans TaxID=47848 RepID=A0ABW0FJW1_9MICO|nr:hypothetical protein [Brachybacterium tyrofermentans]